MTSIITYRHPAYTACYDKWLKWRLVYEGGDNFVDFYLKKRRKEKASDYFNRKSVSPSPSFAKSAIQEVTNSVYMRLQDVSRRGGSKSYNDAVRGLNLGVDLNGHSMNQFIGLEVAPELLAMAKVGVFVDAPPIEGPTLRDQRGARPYIYKYGPEDILSWSPHPAKIGEYQALLLRECVDRCCPDSKLPLGTWTRYRHVWLGEDGVVHVKFYNESGKQVDENGDPVLAADYIIELPYVPFICEELSNSLLADVANHQIALLNMESADVEYILQATKAFYVEQQNLNTAIMARRSHDGEAEPKPTEDDVEVKTGEIQGRIYGPNMERPGFINPSSEPLLASMKKQDALKVDIRRLIHLALSTVQPKMASAESKAKDSQGLEAGLSHVGTVLEHLENRIAQIWADYEGDKTPAEISYPKSYSLQTDEDRQREVEKLEELRDVVPSTTFQKQISKSMVRILMGHRLSQAELSKIDSEIDSAPTINASEEALVTRHKEGLMDAELFAKITGMPPETVKKAADEHAARLARIAESQSKARGMDNPAARGNPDESGSPSKDAADEKSQSRQTDTKESTEDPVRGEGKNVSE